MKYMIDGFKHICVLFRVCDSEFEEEYHVCSKYFPTYRCRTGIPDNSLVIPRYSCLPFYEELEQDLRWKNCKLINSYQDHNYIVNLNWIHDLGGLTPKTWWLDSGFSLDMLPNDKSFVVKGKINSRKHSWNKRMFAPTKGDVMNRVSSLMDDELIRDQGIIIREYIPLVKFEEGINGLPITNEWRIFFLNGVPFSQSYYWVIADDLEKLQTASRPPENFIKKISKFAKRVPFCVFDIAEKEEGGWIVVEMNDAGMSGLASGSLGLFYNNLKNLIFD